MANWPLTPWTTETARRTLQLATLRATEFGSRIGAPIRAQLPTVTALRAMPLSKRVGFAMFAVPPLLPAAAWFASRGSSHTTLAAFAPMLVLFGLVPVLDALIGKDLDNHAQVDEGALRQDKFFDWLLLLCVPLQFASIAFGLWITRQPGLSPVALGGYALSVGMVSTIIAINTGHELVHRRSAFLAHAGGVLLATVGYASFKVEHVVGHHVHIATPEDGSSAARGENVYGFVWRALKHNIPTAFRLEQRLAKRGGGQWVWHRSELVRYYAFTGALLIASFLAAGWRGPVFFVAQGLVAIVMLELVNFIEHYGLRRRKTASGAYEVATALHSWNSSDRLTNLLLFQLQRHSDHHANAARPYQVLRHMEASPQLPAGYPTMILLALIPPLYRRVMHPRLDAALAGQAAANPVE